MSDKLRASLKEVYKYPIHGKEWETLVFQKAKEWHDFVIFSLFFQINKSHDDTCNKLIVEMSDDLRLSLREEV